MHKSKLLTFSGSNTTFNIHVQENARVSTYYHAFTKLSIPIELINNSNLNISDPDPRAISARFGVELNTNVHTRFFRLKIKK